VSTTAGVPAVKDEKKSWAWSWIMNDECLLWLTAKLLQRHQRRDLAKLRDERRGCSIHFIMRSRRTPILRQIERGVDERTVAVSDDVSASWQLHSATDFKQRTDYWDSDGKINRRLTAQNRTAALAG